MLQIVILSLKGLQSLFEVGASLTNGLAGADGCKLIIHFTIVVEDEIVPLDSPLQDKQNGIGHVERYA